MIMPISLDELCIEIRERSLPVATHSSRVTAGGVFVVMPAPVPGSQIAKTPGGERYISNALEHRPSVVVCTQEHLPLLEGHLPAGSCLRVVTVPSTRTALGPIARASVGDKSSLPFVVGVTGTNGKTTTTYILEALFKALGKRVGVLGTVSYRWPGYFEDAPLTTPDCLTLHSYMAAMGEASVDFAFMEVSSHAIDQERIAGLEFGAALFTNLTQDHLDYHSDLEEYFSVKARLFRNPEAGGFPFNNKICVCNADDAYCRKIIEGNTAAVGFGLKEKPVKGSRHLFGRIIDQSPHGLHLAMEFEGQKWELRSPLVGEFNAMNLLGVQAMALALGVNSHELQALDSFSGVSGRMERIINSQGLNVFVDYAHTPDALAKALATLRSTGFSRVITVFGCGGNRDRTKRPLMGEVVARFADVAVVTSDNPRFEDPEAIMADILPGLIACQKVICEPDRKVAIEKALALLGPNDVLLVAGKGHERYQQVNDRKLPFSDQDTLQELLV